MPPESRFARYAVYKDSGVEWLGEVPANWDILPLKRVAQVSPTKGNVGHVDPATLVTFLPMDAIGNDGNIDASSERPISDVYKGYTYFEDDDVIVAKVTPCFENGKCAVLSGLRNGLGFGTTEVTALRSSSKAIPKWIFYVLRAPEAVSVGQSWMYGVAGLQRVPDEFFRTLPLPLPTRCEQHTISAFLDRETAKIDALIAKQERLIALLTEKRQAMISHVVTKGLNSNAPMKDSGIEWLGTISQHWEIRRLKWLCAVELSNADKNLVEGEASVLLCNYLDVYRNDRITPGMDFMSATATDEQIKRLSIRRGDVLITKDSEDPTDIGVPAYVPDTLDGVLCGYHLAILRPRRLCGLYLNYVLKSHYIRSQFAAQANGLTRYALGKYGIRNACVPLPPGPEQRAIAAFLDRETAKIDTLVAKANRSIELLKEHRAALISAAVTGKIDVRGLAE